MTSSRSLRVPADNRWRRADHQDREASTKATEIQNSHCRGWRRSQSGTQCIPRAADAQSYGSRAEPTVASRSGAGSAAAHGTSNRHSDVGQTAHPLSR